jgi:hypothetical protein
MERVRRAGFKFGRELYLTIGYVTQITVDEVCQLSDQVSEPSTISEKKERKFRTSEQGQKRLLTWDVHDLQLRRQLAQLGRRWVVWFRPRVEAK